MQDDKEGRKPRTKQPNTEKIFLSSFLANMLLEKDMYPQRSLSPLFYFNMHEKKKNNKTKGVLKLSTCLFLFVQNTLT